jgi:hypothetical protein
MKKYLFLLIIGPSILYSMEQSSDLDPKIEALFEAAEHNVESPQDAVESCDAQKKELANQAANTSGNHGLKSTKFQEKKDNGGESLVTHALRAHIRLGNFGKVRELILDGAQLSSDDVEKTLKSLNAKNPNATEQMRTTIQTAQIAFKQKQVM